MTQKDTKDILGGLGMTALGLFAAWHAYSEYEFGDLTRMGAGYFPVSLGLLLAAVGLLIAIPAFFREGEPIKLEMKTFGLVIVSLVVFAFLLKTLGLVVATIAAVFLSTLADHDISWRARGIVAISIAALTWLVFAFGLSMVLPVWPWSV
jgi:hypothetical protein